MSLVQSCLYWFISSRPGKLGFHWLPLGLVLDIFNNGATYHVAETISSNTAPNHHQARHTLLIACDTSRLLAFDIRGQRVTSKCTSWEKFELIWLWIGIDFDLYLCKELDWLFQRSSGGIILRYRWTNFWEYAMPQLAFFQRLCPGLTCIMSDDLNWIDAWDRVDF